MTLMLATYEPELITEYSPTWADLAKTQIFNYLCSMGIPTGAVSDNDNLLFVGETSPYIQMAASMKKKFSILLFLPNPFHILSEMALLSADTLYTINAEHSFVVRTWLSERFGGARTFKVMNWEQFPKMYEPPVRSRKLIGIMEPDFNSGDIFDSFYNSLSSMIASSLYSTSFDYAFYTYHLETYTRLKDRNSKVPLFYMPDEQNSPLTDIHLMPNAILSMDSLRYNPILSAMSRRIPVVHPDWAIANKLEKLGFEMRNSINGAEVAHRVLNDFVNQIGVIEELEKSKRIQDDLTRRAMLGDIYGDYSKFRRTE